MGTTILPPLNTLVNFTCKDDFFETNFTCLPRCDIWDARRQDAIATLENVIGTACAVLDIIASVLVFLVFAIRRNIL